MKTRIEEEEMSDEELAEEKELAIEQSKKPQPKKQSEDRYSAFHQPELNGIIDNKEKKVLSTDVLEILNVILNKVQKLEEGLLGN